MPKANTLKDLLLHHLKRNQLKDQLIGIELEIELQKGLSIEAKKTLSTEKKDVDRLERKKILHTNKKRFLEKLNDEKSEEMKAYNQYEFLLINIQKLEDKKTKLIEAFKSMENVKDQLISEAEKKESRLMSQKEFARKINIIELKRKRLLKNGADVDRILQSYQNVYDDYMSFYKIFRIIKYSNSATKEYYGAAKYSSYKKKKLIEKYQKVLIELQLKINSLQSDVKTLNLKIDSISFDDCILFLKAFYKLNLSQPYGFLEYDRRFKNLDRLRGILASILDKLWPLLKRVDRANREIDKEKLFFITDYPE